MRRASWSCLVLAFVAVSIPTRADDSKSRPNKDAAFAARVQSLTDVVLKRHIDPPTRQQMILDGTRAVHRTAGESVPQGASRRISRMATDAELRDFLKELQARFEKKLRTDEVFVAGLLSSLPGGARLISAEELKVQGQLNANRYVGTGIALSVDRKANLAVIHKVFYNGPAWKAGIKAGDQILEIDGKNTKNMALADVVKLLRGERGSVVVVKVRQPRSKDVRTLKITRDVAFIPTVEGRREVSPGHWDFRTNSAPEIAYVRINRIGSSTLHELRQAEARLRGKKIRGIVLDLRDGGGTLHDIILVADALLDRGIIGRVRSGEKVTTHNSSRGALFANLPMAVLVLPTTSSGNEFLAAALQDNGRAVIVGEPTDGDGFVRSSIPLPGGNGAVVLATGELQRGDGTPLRAPRNSRMAHVQIGGKTGVTAKRSPGGIIPDFRVRPRIQRGPAVAQKPSARGTQAPVEDPFVFRAIEVLNSRLKEADSRTTQPGKDKG